jgi:hypothetical protein
MFGTGQHQWVKCRTKRVTAPDSIETMVRISLLHLKSGLTMSILASYRSSDTSHSEAHIDTHLRIQWEFRHDPP